MTASIIQRLIACACLVLVCAFVSCYQPTIQAPAVQAPDDGSDKFVYVLEDDSIPFEDESLTVDTTLRAQYIAISLLNKTDKVVKVIWDECAYIGFNGQTHMVFHSGVKLDEREKPKVPSLIAPHGNFDEILIPVDMVAYDNRLGLGWKHTDDLYPHKRRMSEAYIQYLLSDAFIKGVTFLKEQDPKLREAELRNKSDKSVLDAMVGKKYGVILTVEVGNEKKTYPIYDTIREVKEVSSDVYEQVFQTSISRERRKKFEKSMRSW
ncbi:hypothetical protein HYR99_13675 [Candidatus Poribacteria bacterium]|nr:hypothetical protein [Candidatus Poribacteria bacterium]